jgi:adenine nucleotide transporter 17
MMLRQLVIRKGLRQLYSGLKADTLSTLISSFLYFFFYSSLHKLVLARSNLYRSHKTNPGAENRTITSKVGEGQSRQLDAKAELLIGLIAGVASKGITLPISAVSVRQQLAVDAVGENDEYPNLMTTLRLIHNESGVLGLFAALPPSIPLALLPSLTLYIHSVLLRFFVPARNQLHPPGLVTFALGSASNALATIPLYPMILTKSLRQSRSKENKGMIATLLEILASEGIMGIYKGVEGQLAKGVLQQGIMMLLKQR